VPSLSARRIRGDNLQTRTIGVFALDTATTPFAVELLLSIEQTAQQAGWNVFILNLLSNPPTDQNIDLMLSHRPDGLIFSAMGLRQVCIPERLKSTRLVLANCLADDSRLVSYVPDVKWGSIEPYITPLSQGYRRPLLINLPNRAWRGGCGKKACSVPVRHSGCCLRHSCNMTFPIMTPMVKPRPSSTGTSSRVAPNSTF